MIGKPYASRMSHFSNEELARIYELHMNLNLWQEDAAKDERIWLYPLSEVIDEAHYRGMTLNDLEEYLIY